MKGSFDHHKKYESQSVSKGRGPREKRNSGIEQGLAETIQGRPLSATTTASMAALGYLSPPPSELSQDTAHPNVGEELEEYLHSNANLKTTIVESLRRLGRELEDAQIEAFLEHDPEEQDVTRPVIEVRSSFDSIEEYRSMKNRVRDIVRETERDESMVYTRINQSE